jgi:cell division protein FtsW (lipid II flippase)
MNPRITFALRIALAVLIVMLVVILLSVNKISSSIVLIITFVVVLLPLKSQWAKWCRVAFVLVVFALVAWNISTTEYPVGYYNTGFKFFDQVLHIFDGFLQNVFNTSLNSGKPSVVR